MLIDPDRVGSLSPLRLGLFLRVNAGGRSSGIASIIDAPTRSGWLIAEFSFRPLGWLLTFDDNTIPGTMDVSAWSEVGFHTKVDLDIKVPCQWAEYAIPGDFRPPK